MGKICLSLLCNHLKAITVFRLKLVLYIYKWSLSSPHSLCFDNILEKYWFTLPLAVIQNSQNTCIAFVLEMAFSFFMVHQRGKLE